MKSTTDLPFYLGRAMRGPEVTLQCEINPESHSNDDNGVTQLKGWAKTSILEFSKYPDSINPVDLISHLV
jgi:hypothetical protein